MNTTLRMIAMITLNTAPHAKVFKTVGHGSRPYRGELRIQTRETSGNAKAAMNRISRKYGELARSAMRVLDQASLARAASWRSFAWAAASRATGTRNGEQET